MLLFSEADGVSAFGSSFSRRVFSLEMIRRDVIVGLRMGWRRGMKGRVCGELMGR